MKTLLFILLLVPAVASGVSCPKWTYPENHKLDDEWNSLCQQLSNPTFGNVTASSVTATFVSVSTGTFKQVNATTGTINSFMVVGTATNDDAPVGRPGETITSSAFLVNSPGNNTWGDVTSISLTAGDWDVSGMVYLQNSGGATWSQAIGGIGTVTGNSGTGVTLGDTGGNLRFASTSTTIVECVITIPAVRKSIASTTTYYLKHLESTSAGTPQAGGRISARRVR